MDHDCRFVWVPEAILTISASLRASKKLWLSNALRASVCSSDCISGLVC